MSAVGDGDGDGARHGADDDEGVVIQKVTQNGAYGARDDDANGDADDGHANANDDGDEDAAVR